MFLHADMIHRAEKHVTVEEFEAIDLCRNARIALNGRLQEAVIEADDTRGYIIKCVLPYKSAGESILVERLTDQVKIVDVREWDIHAAYTRCDRG